MQKKLFSAALLLALAITGNKGMAQNVQTKAPTVLNSLGAAEPDVLRVQNGLVSHRVSGTVGQFGTSDQWIGIGAPLSSLYGERTQWNGQSFIKALRRRNATGDTAKDAILEWGNQGGEMQFRYITNPTVATGFRRILTLTPNGNAYFGSTPPPTVISTPRLGVNANAGGVGISTTAIDGVAGVFNAVANSNSSSIAIGVLGFAEASNSTSRNYPVRALVLNIPDSGENVGVSSVIGLTPLPPGVGCTNFGVVGTVNKVSPDGYQVGVLGEIAQQSADVNSTNYAVAGFATNVGTSYAGYFQGNVFCTGLYQGSDNKLKQNVAIETGALEILRKLNPVTYDYAVANHKGFGLPSYKQHGLIAQEVQAVLPELVKTNRYVTKDEKGKANLSEDFLAVNYLGFIPILIKAVQEQEKMVQQQQTMLDRQQATINALKAALGQQGKPVAETTETSVTTAAGRFKASQFMLSQNTPNPFSGSTVIRYSLPKGVSNATLAVFDLNGKLQLQYGNLNGSSQVTISGNTLSAGMYIYALLVEGQEVVSKRMILTQ